MQVDQVENTGKDDEVKENWFDLALDRNLLDPNFEGYKLSLDTFVHYKLEMANDAKLDTYNYVESGESTQKFYLYQHLKLFALQNLLM